MHSKLTRGSVDWRLCSIFVFNFEVTQLKNLAILADDFQYWYFLDRLFFHNMKINVGMAFLQDFIQYC